LTQGDVAVLTGVGVCGRCARSRPTGWPSRGPARLPPGTFGLAGADLAAFHQAPAIVAARTAEHPGFPLAAFAAELAGTGGRLDALAAGDPATEVRADS
jgi:hypothetical protein